MLSTPVRVLVLGAIALAATSTTAELAATNGTRELKQTCITLVNTRGCAAKKSANWDNILYACSWVHSVNEGSWTNFFYKRYDGGLESECACDHDLSTYDPWGSRWTKSSDGGVVCYTRDGKSAQQVRSQFDSINCPNPGTNTRCYGTNT
ncbi:hypothetical protein Gpo141_00013353 [Globisporangium polare]